MFKKKWFKISLVIFGVLVFSSVVSFGSILFYKKYYEEKPLVNTINTDTTSSVVKKLGEDNILRAHLKWDNGIMYFKIKFLGKFYKTIKKNLGNPIHQITIQLLDEDDFTIFKIPVKMFMLINEESDTEDIEIDDIKLYFSEYVYEDKIEMERGDFVKIEGLSANSNFLFNDTK